MSYEMNVLHVLYMNFKRQEFNTVLRNICLSASTRKFIPPIPDAFQSIHDPFETFHTVVL
jgi:hypothetical protein